MKKVLLLAAVLGVLAPARANDSAIEGTSGTPSALGSLKNVRVLRGEHPTVRMVRERVDVVVSANNYDVTANFEFHNSGAARTVLMGFPESASGDTDFERVKRRTTFKDFTSWVDGRKVKTQRVVLGQPQEDYDLDAYWVKAVPFARNQTRNVRVAYRAPLGSTSMGEQYLFYDFTGGNWKGKVDDSLMTVRFASPGHYLIPSRQYDTPNKAVRWRREHTLFYRWSNWQAEQGFSVRFTRTLPGALMAAENDEQLNERWSSWENPIELDVKSSAKNFDVWNSPVSLDPHGVLRDGRAFVQLRFLSDEMREKWERQKNGGKSSDAAGLYVNSGLYIAPNYAGRGILSFTPGDRKAVIGTKTVTLPAAPFLAGGVLYVPLASTVQNLNGTMKINTKTRRFSFDVPL